MIDYSFFEPLLNELFYRGTCTVEVAKTHKDPETRKTEKAVEVIYKDLPCLRSDDSKDLSVSRDLPEANKKVMLLIDPEPSIPAGSKITVTQDGITQAYRHSGVVNPFPGHQELELELWETAI